MSSTQPHAAPSRTRRVLKVLVISLVLVLVVGGVAGVLIYRHLDNNITSLDVTKQLGTDRPTPVIKKNEPQQPLNILLIGSDTRQGKGNNIGGKTPGLSDTTILLHINAERSLAYGVSLPRDAMVDRPTCVAKTGGQTLPAQFSQFNDAYAVGGPACTIKTVEKLTQVRIDHFVVIDFNGFKQMVNALGGVQVCIPTAVNDNVGHINFEKGTYTVKGKRALSYVRERYGFGDGSDVGRMKRQQTFLAAMTHKAVSAGTLANPVRLYDFLDAATRSLTTDPGLAGLQPLASLAQQLRGIGLDKVQFLTVPFKVYAPDPNRLVWKTKPADRIWEAMRQDQALPKKQGKGVTTAAGATKSKNKSQNAAQAAQARENGLCA